MTKKVGIIWPLQKLIKLIPFDKFLLIETAKRLMNRITYEE